MEMYLIYGLMWTILSTLQDIEDNNYKWSNKIVLSIIKNMLLWPLGCLKELIKILKNEG